MNGLTRQRMTETAWALIVRNAESIHAELTAALGQSENIVVDWSDATEVDVSAVQLLLAARKSALCQGKSIALASPASGALLDALLRGGFLNPEDEEGKSPEADFWLKGVEAQ